MRNQAEKISQTRQSENAIRASGSGIQNLTSGHEPALSEQNTPSQDDQPWSGGYNEAFIIHYWSSYTPRF